MMRLLTMTAALPLIIITVLLMAIISLLMRAVVGLKWILEILGVGIQIVRKGCEDKNCEICKNYEKAK